VAELLHALRDQSEALKSGSDARAALADGRRRCLLRLLMAGTGQDASGARRALPDA
jgi:hypothetical protein